MQNINSPLSQTTVRQYCTKKYWGRTSSITEMDDNGNMDDNMASTQELNSIVKAIQKNDMDSLASCLNETSGKDISGQMVTVTLPRKWHNVAKVAKSTPLRTSITWRNVKALSMILNSKCIIQQDDILYGFQKILRHIHTEVELEIIQQLIRHNTSVESPVHFTLAFEKLYLAGDLETSRQLVQIICQSNPSNHILGQTLLSVAKRSTKNHNPQEDNILTDLWPKFSADSTKWVLEAGFSPTQFLMDIKVWLSFSRVAFQHLTHALPLLVQTMTKCPLEAMGWVLRHACRYYPHTNPEGKARIKQLPRLMYAAGMDIPKILSVACLSPRFMDDTGFTQYSKRRTLRSLQEQCKFAVRNHVTAGNVYFAMEHITCIPNPIRDFILLKDIHNLPWVNLY